MTCYCCKRLRGEIEWLHDRLALQRQLINETVSKLLDLQSKSLDDAFQIGWFAEQIRGLGGIPEWKSFPDTTHGSSAIERTKRNADSESANANRHERIEPTMSEIA